MSDQSQNVCQDQETFNEALREGIDSYNEQRKVSTGYMLFYLILALFFLVWALILAYQPKRSQERLLHLFLALLASPLYVLSYYMNCLKK